MEESNKELMVYETKYDYTKEVFDKFQELFYKYQTKKSVIILTIFFSLVFIIPGIVFIVAFKILNKKQCKKIWEKEMESADGNSPFQSVEFYNDYLIYETCSAKATFKYKEFNKIYLVKEGILFVMSDTRSGFYVPSSALNNSKYLYNLLIVLPNSVKK